MEKELYLRERKSCARSYLCVLCWEIRERANSFAGHNNKIIYVRIIYIYIYICVCVHTFHDMIFVVEQTSFELTLLELEGNESLFMNN